MKLKVAMLDTDAIYVERIVSIFNTMFSDKLEVSSFTEYDVAKEFIKQNPLDVILVSDAIDFDLKLIPKRCAFAFLTDKKDIDLFKDQRIIFKYQKVDIIYKEILSIFSEKSESVISYKTDDLGNTKILTFFSGSGGTGGTTAAVACAVRMARFQKKVLYLDLELSSNVGQFLQGPGQFSMTDIIYSLKSNKSNLMLKLESSVKCDERGVYFYDASQLALDMMELNVDDIHHLLDELVISNTYDMIIVNGDFNFDKKSFLLMDMARYVIFVLDGSEVGNCKFERIHQSLAALDGQKEKPILPKLSIMYNRYSNKTSNTVNAEVNVLGGAPRYEGGSIKDIVGQLAGLQIFDHLL
ncbi:hypothetical protein lbkm_0119 [Lachnospiraceae bacterium KM106-2]|nr:hypothetical protein lbkm_0119 [Lachnospiraceae bacterium KM106-2]